MGGKQSKAAEMVAKQTKHKLKTPARVPKGQGSVLGKIESNYVKKQYTHLRQIEQEFEKQIKNPKPAPLRTSVTGRPDHAESLSAEERQRRIDEAQQGDLDEDLADRLRKVGKLTENIKDVAEDGIKITGAPADTQHAAYQTKSNQRLRGRVPSYELINIISNHKTDPVDWSAPEISKLLNMREPDVENIIKYYSLIDETEVVFKEPPRMRWSQEYSCWMVGEPLPKNPTLEDFKDNWKNEKKMISPHLVQKLQKMHDRGDVKYNFTYVKELNKQYYIPPEIFEGLMEPLKPEDKLTITGEHISREKLGIADGPLTALKFMETVEKTTALSSGSPARPQLAESGAPELEGSKSIEHQTQVKRKAGALNPGAKSAEPRRFDDDASYDPRYSRN